jgi:DUF917 family protein
MTRPAITEERMTEASQIFRASVQQLASLRAVSLTGNKAVCGEIGGPACMCQPENHGGHGACGKVIAPIVDADGMQRANFAAGWRV